MVSAFALRANEEYLSVNWLEFFGSLERETAVQSIRGVFHSKGYRLRRNGRFAILNIEDIRELSHEIGKSSLRVEHLPLENDASHAGILGYTADDFSIALEIKALVGTKDVYPAIPE